jgi:hypothetical protein
MRFVMFAKAPLILPTQGLKNWASSGPDGIRVHSCGFVGNVLRAVSQAFFGASLEPANFSRVFYAAKAGDAAVARWRGSRTAGPSDSPLWTPVGMASWKRIKQGFHGSTEGRDPRWSRRDSFLA